MIMREDIDPMWSTDDVALFAATVGAVQQAIKEVAVKYGRGNDPVLPLLAKAGLVGVKGLLLESGMRSDRSSVHAFNNYCNMLRREISEAPEQCKAFEATMIYHGRA
jgi:hypothetical protein